MTTAERAKLWRAVVGAVVGMVLSAALHVVAAHCARCYAASLQPFSALHVYVVQLAGFMATVLAGGAVAGLVGGQWGGLSGALVGLAAGTGIRDCFLGWLVAVIPAWPAAPAPAAGLSQNVDTALLLSTAAHLSARTVAAAVLHAIFWVAAVIYAGWAGAMLGRRAAARASRCWGKD